MSHHVDLGSLVKAYAGGSRDSSLLVSIARGLLRAGAALTAPDGSRRTALHFFNEAFARQPQLRERHRADYFSSIALGPYVRGDGVSESDLRAALRGPSVRSRDLTAYVLDFIRDTDAGRALVELKEDNVERHIPSLFKSKLLQVALETIPVADWKIEQGLALVRRTLLTAALDQSALPTTDISRLSVSLAIQCLHNEFIYRATGAERRDADILAKSVAADIASAVRIDRFAIAVLASYGQLRDRLPGVAHDQLPSGLEKLVRLHFLEPQEEARLASSIPSLTTVADPTSRAVRAQYEHNPFPTWSHARTAAHGLSVQAWLTAAFGWVPSFLRLPEYSSADATRQRII